MSRIKEIRERLRLTQTALAQLLGCTQGNIGHYEKGQTIPPDRAEKLIAVAASKKLRLSLDQIYGLKSLPEEKASA